MLVGISGKPGLRRVIDQAEGRTLSDAELDWEWRDLTKPTGPDLMPDSRDHLESVRSLHGSTSLYLHDSQWSIYRFQRRTLLTTDQPVVLGVGADHPKWEGVGIANAAAFLLPSSRQTALVIRPRSSKDLQAGYFAPDLELAGTTLVANGINQELVAHAKLHIYMHPDDSLTDDLNLPQPNRRRWQMTNADSFINEDGPFPGAGQDQSEDTGDASPFGEQASHGDSMSIDDLPWPIPNRVTPDRPTNW
ncbi:DUF4238 domain-containing protein [Actinosynnema sp. CA-248983]